MSKALRVSHLSLTGQILFFGLRNSLKIFLIISLILLITAKSSPRLNSFISKYSVEISKPIFLVINFPFYFVTELKNNVQNFAVLSKENKKLKIENITLKSQLFELRHLAQENQSLRSLLNYSEEGYANFVTSRIFVSLDNPFNKLALIDKGAKDNLKKGQVITNSDGLLGRIIKVGERSSHILLLTDFQSKIPVYSSGSAENAVLVGRGDKLPRLKYLRKNHQLQENEIIYSSGDGQMYPAHLPIGTALRDNDGNMVVLPFVDFSLSNIVKVHF